MESDGEDLDDIFEENEITENGANNTENNQNSNENSNAIKIAPPKRVVKNPRLKFNPERLCGERGIPILVDHFKNVKFKGVGYEKEDLDKLLSKLEHWTHRLFPSMKFEDCLLHIEKLGKKRPVQTCLRKIRLDMPILSNDFVKDEDDIQRNDDDEEVDAFDRLIEESQNVLQPADEMNSSYSPPRSRGHVLGSSFGSSMTEEQKERMERNRLLAAERRKARLQQDSAQSAFQEAIPSSSQSTSAAQSSFDALWNSSAKNQEDSTQGIDDESMEVGHEDKGNETVGVLELNEDVSENLGLEDLIDLVDDEEDNKNEKVGAVELNKDGSENLGLDDLIDLVDGDEEKPDKSSPTSETLDLPPLSSHEMFSQNEDGMTLVSRTANEENESLSDCVDGNPED